MFPLEELIEYRGNIYEITAAASRRAYQLSLLEDSQSEFNEDEPVSHAAQQLFQGEVKFQIES
ncbi:MAG: DNA-directed RNA polymerase subunit omega [Treponema sp.]|jgi:DNA-directed RNA polymerase subunit omega|nr:DNA-directed RNA polymerase subunit omega [Treponema sp.]